MKKLLAILLSIVCVAVLFAGCGAIHSEEDDGEDGKNVEDVTGHTYFYAGGLYDFTLAFKANGKGVYTVDDKDGSTPSDFEMTWRQDGDKVYYTVYYVPGDDDVEEIECQIESTGDIRAVKYDFLFVKQN